MDEPELAKIYDVVHQKRGEDYCAEAQHVADLVRTRVPDASSLIDVACGPGAHLRYFTALFAHTEGLELSESMLGVAHTKAPRSRLHCEDMRTFTLGRTFDAVTCMFGSVGYTRDEEELNATVERFALHTRPGGVVVVEPWWFPEHFTDGYVAGDLSQEEGRTITRVSYSTRRGNTTVMRVHFTVADASGIQEFTEVDLLTLFAREDYVNAFEAAGCRVELLEGAPTGRGVFIGVPRVSTRPRPAQEVSSSTSAAMVWT